MDRSVTVVCIGGAAVDVTAHTFSPVTLHDSNPGRIFTSPGGVTRNICENLARMGCSTILLTAVGNDAFGKEILSVCAAAGIDVSRVLVSADYRTACYLAILDDTGEMHTGASDFSVAKEITPSYITEKQTLIRGADAVVTDANLSREQLEAILAAAGDVPVAIDPVSEAKSRKIREIIGSFAVVKPNRMELGALSGIRCECDTDIERACSVLLRKGCREIVVSLGARGCYYADRNGAHMFRKMHARTEMANATGAGDAFLAGYVSGLVRGLSTEDRLARALAAGFLAVMDENTICRCMSEELIDKTILKYMKKGRTDT